MNVDKAVRQRYSEAARRRVDELCCPVRYDESLLEALPDAIRRLDYGCGDPSRHVRPGETVLDLGCGGGKICYIAAQLVGPGGRVIGVDTNDEMLRLAESHRTSIGDRLGYHNVSFHKARIQDLALDQDEVERYLAQHPIDDDAARRSFERWAAARRRRRPLIPGGSVDVVVSNCVLNLVDPRDKERLFAEMVRVLRPGGRAVISDIVGDRDVPAELQADPELWSGCISGAFREDRFYAAFEQAGFGPVEVLARGDEPWRVVEGIAFHSVTVRAHRPAAGGSPPREEPPAAPCCG